MKDLIVSSTFKEIEPFLKYCCSTGSAKTGELIKNEKFNLLISGVGVLATSYHLTKALHEESYGLVMNFGIAGSFKKELPVKSLVSIKEEILSDFGAEGEEGQYLDIFDMGLSSKDDFPFKNGILSVNDDLKITDHLPEVRSLTVGRVLSHDHSISWAKDRFQPDVVNMEGAAVFYVCLQNAIPCIQVRSISDFVGKRDKSTWDIAGAIDALNTEVIKIYERRYNIS